MIDNKLIADKLREIADEVEKSQETLKSVVIENEKIHHGMSGASLLQTTANVSIETKLSDTVNLMFKHQEKL